MNPQTEIPVEPPPPAQPQRRASRGQGRPHGCCVRRALQVDQADGAGMTGFLLRFVFREAKLAATRRAATLRDDWVIIGKVLEEAREAKRHG
jgi:hypothetical protein